jgi:peroxiredoxin
VSDFALYPAPVDDRAAEGLEGRSLPDVSLPSSAGSSTNLARAADRLVLYVYPSATGTPDLPTPDWAQIPGAIGCTAESCAFRDRKASFESLGVTVMGLSAQTAEAQRAFAARKDINFTLLSDDGLILARQLGLPTFQAGALHLYRRLTLYAESGGIVKVWYPVFPPDTHPAEVLAWVERHVEGRQ